MKSPVPQLIRRPSRSVPSILLAVVLLAVGSLGVWMLGHRLFVGTWPESTVSTLTAIGSTNLGSAVAIIVAGVIAVFGVIMIIAALVPGLPDCVEVFPDTIPGQTVVRRRDLAKLFESQIEQIDGVHSVIVTTHRSRVDVVVRSLLDDLNPVHAAVSKKTDEVLKMLAPAGIKRSHVRIKHTS